MNPNLEQTEKAICSHCGNSYLHEDLIRFDEALICASCKPKFFQVLRETGRVYAAYIPAEPFFFPVSQLKFLVMSLCTLGIYEVFWFYKNWELIKNRHEKKIRPFWRAVFYLFFIYQFCKHVKKSADENNIRTSWRPAILTVIFVLIFFLPVAMPEPYWLFSYLTIVPLVIVQGTVNQINARVAPAADKNDFFTWKNIVAMFIGILFTTLSIIGYRLPLPD